MNTTIPGAEYAPTINLGIRPSTLGDWEQVERRLSVTDPDDMRAIWYRAALALGATEEEALHADLRRYLDGWRLVIASADRHENEASLITVEAADLKHATGALCAHIWGPK